MASKKFENYNEQWRKCLKCKGYFETFGGNDNTEFCEDCIAEEEYMESIKHVLLNEERR